MLFRPFDILCVGELLIDLISEKQAPSLELAETFRRVPGGSPANLCTNMARLGNKALLAATVGSDRMGDYLLQYVCSLGIDTRLIRQVVEPTSVIFLTRSRSVAQFEPYRSADFLIEREQLDPALLKKSRLFHTTCFALSREPARSTILAAAHQAHRYNCQLSLDLNYAYKIWPDREEAMEIVREYCGLGAMVRLSDVDWVRLYQQAEADPEDIAQQFLKMGARQVCLTLGEEGCLVADGREKYRLSGKKMDIIDTTGAGDAFWAGYLTGWLDGKSLLRCAEAGMRMEEQKVRHFGPLPPKVDRQLIY